MHFFSIQLKYIFPLIYCKNDECFFFYFNIPCLIQCFTRQYFASENCSYTIFYSVKYENVKLILLYLMHAGALRYSMCGPAYEICELKSQHQISQSSDSSIKLKGHSAVYHHSINCASSGDGVEALGSAA